MSEPIIGNDGKPLTDKNGNVLTHDLYDDYGPPGTWAKAMADVKAKLAAGVFKLFKRS